MMRTLSPASAVNSTLRLATLLALCLWSPTASAAPPLDYSIQADPGDGRVFLSFPTLPGYHYAVEECGVGTNGELLAWNLTPGGSWYGDGATKNLLVGQGNTPGPEISGVPPTPSPGQSWQLRPLNFQVTVLRTSGNNNVHVRRLASSPYAAWDGIVTLPLPVPPGAPPPPGTPPPPPRSLGLLTQQDGTTLFWASATVSYVSTLPADTLSPAGAQEEYEKAAFLGLKDQLIARLTAPTDPAAASSVTGRRFLRLRRVESDTNANGLPDWWELRWGYNPFTWFSSSQDPNQDGRTLAQEYADGKNPKAPVFPTLTVKRRWRNAAFHDCITSSGRANREWANRGVQPDYLKVNVPPHSYILENIGNQLDDVWDRAKLATQADFDNPGPSENHLTPWVTARAHAHFSKTPHNVAGYGIVTRLLDAAGEANAIVLRAEPGLKTSITRKFVRVMKQRPAYSYPTPPATLPAWIYSAPQERVIIIPASPAPYYESAMAHNARPGLLSLKPETEGNSQVESESWLQPVNLSVDVNGNGVIDSTDDSVDAPARYVVNYNHDEGRFSGSVPLEDAVKWTATSAQTPYWTGEPNRILTPAHEDWNLLTSTNPSGPRENIASLAPLELTEMRELGPNTKVFLRMLKDTETDTETESQAFHLFIQKVSPNGTISYDPIWGGINFSGTKPAAVALGGEVDITKYVNPQAANYTETRASSSGDAPRPYKFVLEGILFPGMPLPLVDEKRGYYPPSNVNDTPPSNTQVFDGELSIGVELRHIVGSNSTTITSDWVRLSCKSPLPAGEIPAFKGPTEETSAQGYGRYAVGGRYGHVYTVTTNIDDANDPRSLRYAVESPVPRTIVFALPQGMDGTINLNKKLAIADRFCTIAGQTAFRNSSQGICLKKFGLEVNTDDVVVRHIRSRPGVHTGIPSNTLGNIDCFAIAGVSSRVIFDHCSASFSNDCLFDTVTADGEQGYFTRPNRRITVQNCLLAWPLDRNSHIEGGQLQEHGFAGQIRAGHGAKITYWGNLYAHYRARGPAIVGVANNEDDPLGPRLDFLNNLLYGWGDKGNAILESVSGYEIGDVATGKGKTESNFVENHYRARLAGNVGSKRWLRIKNRFARIWLEGNVLQFPSGEVGAPDGQYSANYVQYDKDDNDGANEQTTPAKLNPGTPYFTPSGYAPPRVLSVGRAVPGSVGASIRRDALDLRLLGQDGESGEYARGTGSIIDTVDQVEGWPVLLSKQQRPDTDGDGIPDDFEPATPVGRSIPWTQDPRNAQMDDDGDGYTNLEEYLSTAQ